MNFDFNIITLIGFIAQGLFFSRFAVQLIVSEKAKASLSPTIFWIISLLACYLMIIYGYLRNDLSIISGQIIAYYIYIRNLQLKGVWKKIPHLFKYLMLIVPLLLIIYCSVNYKEIIIPILNNSPTKLSWLVLATIGQTVFAFRFIYQWIYSEYHKKSHFPLGFWIISIIGSTIIAIYAIIAKDIVLLIGHGFGLFVYSRNLYLKLAENNK